MKQTLKPLAIASLALALTACDSNRRANDDVDYNERTRSTTTTTSSQRATTQDRVGTAGTTTQTQTQTRTGTLSQSDQQFVREAASGGMFEVQSSQFALQQGRDNDRVQQVAQMMIDDHTKANQELQSLASRKGMTVPQELNAQHKQLMDRLRSAQSDDFARLYMQQQRQAHQDAIALYERASQELSDQDLREFATRTLPVLRRHLQHIEQAMQ